MVHHGRKSEQQVCEAVVNVASTVKKQRGLKVYAQFLPPFWYGPGSHPREYHSQWKDLPTESTYKDNDYYYYYDGDDDDDDDDDDDN
ncbi:hypothetical protein STEG23_010872 [Scotinomys teguina]